MSNILKPISQRIYINSSQGRIYDFNTYSSKTYLGDVVNSLLRVFGNNVVMSGFRILELTYDENHILTTKISPGEVIVDHTLIQYPEETILSLDLTNYDDLNGFVVPNIYFKFSETQQKNYSTIRLSYVTNDGNVPYDSWYITIPTIIFSIFDFNKELKSAVKRPIDVFQKERINILNKEYVVYPVDNISNRIILYINDKFI